MALEQLDVPMRHESETLDVTDPGDISRAMHEWGVLAQAADRPVFVEEIEVAHEQDLAGVNNVGPEGVE